MCTSIPPLLASPPNGGEEDEGERRGRRLTMRAEQTSFLFGANAPFIEELYARYLGNPDAVDSEWRTFFDALGEHKDSVLAEVRGASWAPNGAHIIGAVDPESLPAPANRNLKGNGAAAAA